MKQNLIPALRLTLVCIIFFMGLYSLFILGIAQFAPGKGKGEIVEVDGRVVGWKREGQKFTEDKYFWSRPSAVDYNAAASGGSNKGPTNPEYLQQVRDRIDYFLVHNPSVKKMEIPSDLVTASGGGLDPHISVLGAYVQAARIASIRKLPIGQVNDLIGHHIEGPLLGLFGTRRMNVLELNLALDQLKK